MARRPERVKEAIRRLVSNLIQDELRDPRIGFVTITKVEITDDLRFAKIFYSVLGSEKVKKDTKIGLESAKKFLKMRIGDELKLRFTPDISLREDKSFECSQRIEDVLGRIKKEREDDENRRRNKGDKAP